MVIYFLLSIKESVKGGLSREFAVGGSILVADDIYLTLISCGYRRSAGNTPEIFYILECK